MIGVDSPGPHNPATGLLPPIIRLDSLTFSWAAGQEILLDIEHLDIRAGETLFIEGPSGSGKSTLLNLLAGVLVPQRGEVRILNQEMTSTSSANRDRFRADHIGVIFQMFNLIPYLSIVENVTLPCRFSDRKLKKTTERGSGPSQEAMRMLSALNLVIQSRSKQELSDQRTLERTLRQGRSQRRIASVPTEVAPRSSNKAASASEIATATSGIHLSVSEPGGSQTAWSPTGGFPGAANAMLRRLPMPAPRWSILKSSTERRPERSR